MAESDIILDGLYPLVLLGRFLGYFAFTNVGQVKSTSELRIKLLSSNLLLTVLFTVTVTASYVLSLAGLATASINSESTGNFAQSVIYTLIISYQMLGVCTIIHVNVKSKAFIDFLNRWNSVQSLLRCRKSIKIFGYFITFGVVILTVIYAVFHQTYYINSLTIFTILKPVSMVMSTFVCLYFGGLIVYFSKALQCCFVALEQDLKDCLALESCWKTRLSVIRRRHDLLVSLSHRFNSFMSPILICYLIIESYASCVSIYESMELYLVQHSKNVLEVSRAAVIGIVRFIPVIAICLSGQMVTQQASSIIRPMVRHPMHQLTADSNRQLEMLRFQFLTRIPNISANGFLDVNNRLLGEIMGVMATYIVIMLEVSEGRSH